MAGLTGRRIQNEEIIDAIWRKYETLEDEGFTLDVSLRKRRMSDSRRNPCVLHLV